ncbi:hypothetical protein [Mycolicibacterium chubuense]|uniref:hypothetical protein n=1 Tax=Mycolicibacterium chubuense TaxID=1800 RepID=UPI0013015AB3|nr:hypothetical protein [Mycolicibacterium chubuense]
MKAAVRHGLGDIRVDGCSGSTLSPVVSREHRGSVGVEAERPKSGPAGDRREEGRIKTALLTD